ncbi:hypothetical protein JOC69_000835 [Heliobacterium gestii]|nr:hypothetical protein [Heliomicrobium gestii]
MALQSFPQRVRMKNGIDPARRRVSPVLFHFISKSTAGYPKAIIVAVWLM